VRDVLERASARETAARVAAGALAKAFLETLGVAVHSHVLRIGTVAATARDELAPADFADVDGSPVRCLDAAASEAMVAEIDAARKANESLGGVFEVRAFGLVPGLGSHVSWEERLNGRLSQAIQPHDRGSDVELRCAGHYVRVHRRSIYRVRALDSTMPPR
jgi:chorismate synthase